MCMDMRRKIYWEQQQWGGKQTNTRTQTRMRARQRRIHRETRSIPLWVTRLLVTASASRSIGEIRGGESVAPIMMETMRVMCCGEILFDCFSQSGDGGEKSYDKCILGGAPQNVANHLAQISRYIGECSTCIRVTMASRVGDDELGQKALALMNEAGIDTSFVQVTKVEGSKGSQIEEEPQVEETGRVFVDLDDDGEANYTILGSDDIQGKSIIAWDNIEFDQRLVNEAGQSDVIIYGTLACRNVVSRTTLKALSWAGARRCCDVNFRIPMPSKEVVSSSVESCWLLKMNEYELKTLIKMFPGRVQNKDSVKDMVKGLAASFDCQYICVTFGSEGSALWSSLDQTWTEAKSRLVYDCSDGDSVGAGDAFLAALVYGLWRFESISASPSPMPNLQTILEIANSLGAFVASKSGATPKHDDPDVCKMFKEM